MIEEKQGGVYTVGGQTELEIHSFFKQVCRFSKKLTLKFWSHSLTPMTWPLQIQHNGLEVFDQIWLNLGGSDLSDGFEPIYIQGCAIRKVTLFKKWFEMRLLKNYFQIFEIWIFLNYFLQYLLNQKIIVWLNFVIQLKIVQN